MILATMIRERDVARWLVAAITVAAIHVGGLWAATGWSPAAPAPVMPEPVVMIELATLAVAPEAPRQEVAPGPQMAEAPQEKLPEPIKELTEEPEVAKPEPIETHLPEPEIKLPELPAIPVAEAILAPPPKLVPLRRKVERKTPAKTAQRPPPLPRETALRRPPAPQTSAPVSTEAERAVRAAAPVMGSSTTPSVSPATWRSQLNAHLNRYKRPPPGGATGIARVAFTIDRRGHVHTAQLIASSGDSGLDNEAVAMMRRASPVPLPPTSVGGASITLAVPVSFNR